MELKSMAASNNTTQLHKEAVIMEQKLLEELRKFGGTTEQVHELYELMQNIDALDNPCSYTSKYPKPDYWYQVVELIRNMGNTPEERPDEEGNCALGWAIVGGPYHPAKYSDFKRYEFSRFAEEPEVDLYDDTLHVGWHHTDHSVGMVFKNRDEKRIAITLTCCRKYSDNQGDGELEQKAYFLIKELV